MTDSLTILRAENGHAAVRARLGMPATPKPRVRLDLIGRAPKPKAAAVPLPDDPPPPVSEEPAVPPPKHKLFTAAIVELDENDMPVEPQVAGMPAWRRIARDVCRKYQVSMVELQSHRRAQYVVIARNEAFWRCRQETTMSLPQIGHRFGDRDHTTVLHGIRMHEKRMKEAQGA